MAGSPPRWARGPTAGTPPCPDLAARARPSGWRSEGSVRTRSCASRRLRSHDPDLRGATRSPRRPGQRTRIPCRAAPVVPGRNGVRESVRDTDSRRLRIRAGFEPDLDVLPRLVGNHEAVTAPVDRIGDGDERGGIGLVGVVALHGPAHRGHVAVLADPSLGSVLRLRAGLPFPEYPLVAGATEVGRLEERVPHDRMHVDGRGAFVRAPHRERLRARVQTQMAGDAGHPPRRGGCRAVAPLPEPPNGAGA